MKRRKKDIIALIAFVIATIFLLSLNVFAHNRFGMLNSIIVLLFGFFNGFVPVFKRVFIENNPEKKMKDRTRNIINIIIFILWITLLIIEAIYVNITYLFGLVVIIPLFVWYIISTIKTLNLEKEIEE